MYKCTNNIIIIQDQTHQLKINKLIKNYDFNPTIMWLNIHTGNFWIEPLCFIIIHIFIMYIYKIRYIINTLGDFYNMLNPFLNNKFILQCTHLCIYVH